MKFSRVRLNVWRQPGRTTLCILFGETLHRTPLAEMKQENAGSRPKNSSLGSRSLCRWKQKPNSGRVGKFRRRLVATHWTDAVEPSIFRQQSGAVVETPERRCGLPTARPTTARPDRQKCAFEHSLSVFEPVRRGRNNCSRWFFFNFWKILKKLPPSVQCTKNVDPFRSGFSVISLVKTETWCNQINRPVPRIRSAAFVFVWGCTGHQKRLPRCWNSNCAAFRLQPSAKPKQQRHTLGPLIYCWLPRQQQSPSSKLLHCNLS